MNKNSVKIIISVVFLIAAGLLVAYSLGLFSGGSSRPGGGSSTGITYDEDTTVEDVSTSTVDPDTGGRTLGGQSDAFIQPGRRQ